MTCSAFLAIAILAVPMLALGAWVLRVAFDEDD